MNVLTLSCPAHLRTPLILPNILGDSLAEYFDKITGGRMFDLEQANNLLHPIVICSLSRQCAARLGVAEVCSNVVTFFMSQYSKFIQFCGESDVATRCAQVKLLTASWVKHSDENPLVVIQLDIVNAYPSAIDMLNSMC